MRNATLILLTFVVQSLAKEPPAKSVSGYLPSGSSLHADLDTTGLGKASHLAIHPCRRSNQMLRVSSGSIAPFRLRGSEARRGFDILQAKPCDDDTQPQPATARPFGRRDLGLVLGGVLATEALPQSALAADKKEEIFLDGPEGLKYVDVEAGTGPTPEPGDKVQANYFLALKSIENKGILVDTFQGNEPIKFILKGPRYPPRGVNVPLPGVEKGFLGEGDMPPMKVGGSRKLIIPAALAFGAEGLYCPTKFEPAGPCVVPPDSPLEVQLTLVSILGKTPEKVNAYGFLVNVNSWNSESLVVTCASGLAIFVGIVALLRLRGLDR